MKTLILTENQLRNVIDKVIFEQNESRRETTTVDFGAVWPMGKWKLTNQQISQLNQKLLQITDFINKHKGGTVTIQIESGESQVTNRDREVNPPVDLDPGVLSKRRGDEVVNFLKKYFQGLVGKSISESEIPKIPEAKTIIGSTQYNGPDDLKDKSKLSQYNSEQFVRAVLSAEKNYECIVGMEITIGYFSGKNKATHNCDEAIFELKLNGVSLGEVNLNNGRMDGDLDRIRNRDKRNQESYDKILNKVTKNWESLVKSGDVKDNEREKIKYFEDNLGEKPAPTELPDWITSKANLLGYGEDVNKFINDLDTINSSFKNYGRQSDGRLSGSRSQTFTITGELAESIIKNTPSDKLVFSIVPLVTKDGKYKIFYDKGSHSDTPWVTIKNKKSQQPLFDGEPNVNMKRGATTETILLQTDLCGSPLTKKS